MRNFLSTFCSLSPPFLHRISRGHRMSSKVLSRYNPNLDDRLIAMYQAMAFPKQGGFATTYWSGRENRSMSARRFPLRRSPCGGLGDAKIRMRLMCISWAASGAAKPRAISLVKTFAQLGVFSHPSSGWISSRKALIRVTAREHLGHDLGVYAVTYMCISSV